MNCERRSVSSNKTNTRLKVIETKVDAKKEDTVRQTILVYFKRND